MPFSLRLYITGQSEPITKERTFSLPVHLWTGIIKSSYNVRKVGVKNADGTEKTVY